ncbi:MAG: putative toxin-antitoxin system toxin component, PIN family [Candidatus Tectomicrobia bacterium]|uniref:Toxin-antitoxin system toxin component, PIN family n=1 Tax=Tectimicrobiota bacterium TaxID=2528274 RepID=A0A933LRH7_UNCTE|nr:putative toxin-antitoxin system toxin component, PIN family [Candidatus Tectomicrobia bacterium]
MLKVVFDTNVIISAALTEEGLPALLLSLTLGGKVSPFISPALIKEYQMVLDRPRFKFDPEEVKGLIEKINQKATLVQPTETLSILNDEPDNRILECALKAKADFIITGNKKHFPFTEFKGIEIVTPREFISKIREI